MLVFYLNSRFREGPEADTDNDVVPEVVTEEGFHLSQHLLQGRIQPVKKMTS
jgi:hypothetical protein